jgi:hypothetical protein
MLNLVLEDLTSAKLAHARFANMLVVSCVGNLFSAKGMASSETGRNQR